MERLDVLRGLEVSKEDPTDVYELLEMLGRGSYGSVFKGRHKTTSQIAAIKIIPLEEDEEGLEDLRKEIAILKDCKHENIVGYMGSYFKDTKLWIAMEYCGGGSVSDLCQITENPLTESQIALICREVLKGLAYLHKIRKIHRDIKGGNILLTDQGDIKLADFGVSAQLQNTMSKRNTFVGTPYWMAPEVIQESRYDGRADVWSVGITAIEMAEIIPPLANIHPMRVLFMIPRDPPPKLTEPEKWSTVFKDFIAKCLVKDKITRPTAQELLSHPFVSQSVRSKAILADAVEACKQIVEERGYGLYDDEEDEVEDEGDEDAGTVRTEAVKTTANDAGSGEIFDTAVTMIDNNTVVSPTNTSTNTTSSSTMQMKMNSSGTTVSSGSGTTDSKGQADSNQNVPTFIRRLNESGTIVQNQNQNQSPADNFGLDDELRTLYDRAGTITTPFLNLAHMAPSAMLKTEADFASILKELSPEVDVGDGPAGRGHLHVGGQLGNMLRVLSYYQQRESATPMTAKELEMNRRIVSDLSKTLKTILRL